LVHLGNGRMVLKEHISFILDYQECIKNKSSALFFNQISNQAEKIVISTEPIKSLVYTCHDNQETIYLSPISSVTLLKRSRETVKFDKVWFDSDMKVEKYNL